MGYEETSQLWTSPFSLYLKICECDRLLLYIHIQCWLAEFCGEVVIILCKFLDPRLLILCKCAIISNYQLNLFVMYILMFTFLPLTISSKELQISLILSIWSTLKCLRSYQIRKEYCLKLAVLFKKQTPIKSKIGQKRDLYPIEWWSL